MLKFIRGTAGWALTTALHLHPFPSNAQSPPPLLNSLIQKPVRGLRPGRLAFLERFRARLKEARGAGAGLDFFRNGLAEMEQSFSNPKIRLKLRGRKTAERKPGPDVFDLTALSGFARSGENSARAIGFFINPGAGAVITAFTVRSGPGKAA